jgi:hypothetical protein
LNTNHLHNLLLVNSVLAAPSNAEDLASGATASSTECTPCAHSLVTNQPLPCIAPHGQWAPSGNPLGPHGVGESSSHAGDAAPDLLGFSPVVGQHAAGLAPADFQLASSRVVPVWDTAPTTTGHVPTDFAETADFSPSNPGTDSHEDPARTTGSPIALDNQQVPLAHLHGTRLQNNIRQPKIRTDGTVTYSMSRVSSLEPSSHVTAMKHPLRR